MNKVGFIGLGIMGAPMAQHIIDGGYHLNAHTRSGVPQRLIDKGAIVCAHPQEVAEQSDLIICMLPDTPHVEKVLFGENGVASGLAEGKTVIDMSSISPIETKAFASQINELGCHYLDAPVSGGEVGAQAGSLTIMVGGRKRLSIKQSRYLISWAAILRLSALMATARRVRLPIRSL